MWDGQRRDSLAWAFGLSIALHLILAFTPVWVGPLMPSLGHKDPQTLEIEILPSNRNAATPIVRFAPAPENLKVQESHDPLVFLSEQRQWVSQSQRAAQVGRTQNSLGQGQGQGQDHNPIQNQSQNQIQNQNQSQAANLRGSQAQPPESAENEFKPVDLGGLPQKWQNQNDLFISGPQRRQRIALDSSFRSLDSDTQLGRMGRASTVGEQLPDSIPVGEITALNTDRFTYYSFFARIEDIIRPRWESQVRSGINRMSRQELSLGPSNRFVTQLTVVLDRNGNFLEAQLLRSSNVPSLDQAASEAFRSARILPNPPQGLIEEDGKVRLNYSFTVFIDPRRIARP